MISLHGYKINKRIYESSNSIIYRGVYVKAGTPVVIKLLNGEFPSPEQLARFRREYEMTRRHAGNRIIKAYKLEKYSNTLAIITEDFGGNSLAIHLSDRKYDIKELLSLVIQMTEALGQVHSHHIIHKNVNPSNFVWNPLNNQLKIIDFGISTELPRETTESKSPDVLEGTLAYISPEQTGRMNKSIDYRTDFYSLGVTFYQMLTGHLPFYSDDAMEMVYNHIASIPVSPNRLNPEVPLPISDIIMKLLSKSAADRYQSALGLKKDLVHCLKQIELYGRVSQFKIAQNDISDRFQIPQKLYGREKEINQLINTFERVAIGGKRMLMVTGHSGIGKSSLINEVQKEIVRKQGYFLSGKFDQLKRDTPYATLIQAVKGLIPQLLSEREERIGLIREKLINALGPNGQIIIDVIPDIELIIGKQPDLPELPPEQVRLRFEYTFQNFIGCLSAEEHPLVLFLDDLQWADISSLHMLRVILSNPNLRYMLIIGAYRDNEVRPGHPLLIALADIEQTTSTETLRLAPLEKYHVNQLISETLSVKPEETKNFAELCVNKTLGNPFFLNQFLHMLHRSDTIVFNHKKGLWQWNINRIRRMEITDNVVDLMISKIQELPQNTQRLLSLAACIGTRFDLKTLSVVNKKPMKETAKILWKGLQEDLIEPVDKSYKYVGLSEDTDEPDTSPVIPLYRFVHDKIQQAAYQIVGEDHKPDIHWKIGSMMLEKIYQEERKETFFDIVEHLNLGNAYVKTKEQKDFLALANLGAGVKARDSAAFESSFKYLQESIRLLGENAWERAGSITLDVYTQAAESSYLIGDFIQTEKLAHIILQNTNQLLSQVKIYEIRILSHIVQNRLHEANKLGIDILKKLGESICNNPGKKEMMTADLKVRWALRGKRIEDLVHLPEMTDAYKLACNRIFYRLWTSGMFSNPFLSGLAIFKNMALTIQFGSTPFTPAIYACYGGMLCIFKKINAGYRFGQLALQMLEKPQFRQYRSRTLSVVNSFIFHWKQHIKTTLSDLLTAYQIGIDSGDPETASYSIGWYCLSQKEIGKELNLLLKQDLAPYLAALEKLKVNTAIYAIQILSQVVSNLTGQTDNPCHLVGKYYDEEKMLPIHQKAADGLVLHYLYLNKLYLYYLMEDIHSSLESGKQCKKYMKSSIMTMTVPVTYFYHALARLASYPRLNKSKQKQLLRKVTKGQNRMKLWADHAPANYAHKYHLVEAELAGVLNHTDKAMTHYKLAIKGAKKNEYIQEEALANELFAKFWLKRNDIKIAQLYMKEAHHLYQIWGAAVKVKNLEKRYSYLFTKKSEKAGLHFTAQALHTSINKTENISEALDIDSVMKAAQTISGEIVFTSLIKKMISIVIQNAGAQKAILILKQDGNFMVVVNSSVRKSKQTRFEPMRLENCKELSPAIVNYTIRTHKTVVLSDAANIGEFTQDAYVRNNRSKSICCAPIIRQNELTGVLYLENNRTTDVFTPKRLKVIRILISQASISFENAKLYNTLSQSEEKYRNILKSIAEGYFECDLTGNYTFVNDAALNISGYSKEEMLSLSYKSFMDQKSSRKIFQATHEVYKTGTTIKGYECELIKKAGSKLFCEISISLIKDSAKKPVGFRGIIRDIADRKRKEIAEMKRKAAEAADRAKSAFMAKMSHEIRTPMNAVIGFSNLAIENADLEKKDDYLKKIRSASGNLLGIINDILDFSKMEAGKLVMEQTGFQLNSVLNELSDMFTSQATQKGLELIFSLEKDLPKTLIGDPLRLKQILINLTENAIKFTETGRIKIKIENTPKTAGELENQVKLQFTVQDSGIGITDKQIRKLFNAFAQADNSTTRKYGGTGLGLAISKQLVEMMGGKIRIDSEYGKGSTFSFTAEFGLQTRIDNLYKAQNDLKHKSAIIEGLANIRGAGVLLVEDDEFNQQVARGLLQGKGLNVTVAGNGRAALACINKDIQFDAVLMDIQMPEMDGYEATRRLRRDDRFKTLPIIAMTAYAMEDERKKCIAAGMNDHISKPIDAQSLFTTLIKWILPLEQPTDPKRVQPETAHPIDQLKMNLPQKVDDTAGTELPTHLPGLNLISGLAKIDGQKKLYQKMLKDFGKKYADFSDTLTTAYQNNQIDAVKQMIHTVKGVSGIISADELYGISKEIDECLKKNELDGLEIKLNEFNRSLKTVLDSLDQLIQPDILEETTYQQYAPDIYKLLTELIKFDEFLSLARPDESEYLFDTVKDDLIRLGFIEQIQQLAEKIEDFEYQEARKILARLKDKVTPAPLKV